MLPILLLYLSLFTIPTLISISPSLIHTYSLYLFSLCLLIFIYTLINTGGVEWAGVKVKGGPLINFCKLTERAIKEELREVHSIVRKGHKTKPE